MLSPNYLPNIYDDVDVYHDERRKGRDRMTSVFRFKNKISKNISTSGCRRQVPVNGEFMKKKFWT